MLGLLDSSADRPHDVHRSMKGSRILHRHKRVAFEHEPGNAHQHGEHVVIERLGMLAEESGPYLGRCSKTKSATHIEAWRSNGLDQAAALEPHDAPPLARCH